MARIKSVNLQLNFSFDRATIIHANKYSRPDFAIYFIVTSTLYTEIVFRVEATGADVRVEVKNKNLPVYSGQDVMVISVANIIVGVIDKKTNQYFFITNDLGRSLGMGIPFYWVLPTGILGGLVLYYMLPGIPFAWVFAPLLIAWILYRIQRHFLNRKVEGKVGELLS